MTRRSLLWWLRSGRRKQQQTAGTCPTCKGKGMVRYNGQHPDGDGQYLQWALVCDPCQGTGVVQEATTTQRPRPPQAIRMAPGWLPLPNVNPRPLRMSKQSEFRASVIPFRLPAPEYVPPVTDKVWDQEAADKLWQWAQDDAKGFTDSGDSQQEGA